MTTLTLSRSAPRLGIVRVALVALTAAVIGFYGGRFTTPNMPVYVEFCGHCAPETSLRPVARPEGLGNG